MPRSVNDFIIMNDTQKKFWNYAINVLVEMILFNSFPTGNIFINKFPAFTFKLK